MATKKQLAANKANAQKSTGPRSAAGKKAIRLNAWKHGLSGQLMLIPPEELAAYRAYSDALMPDLAPANLVERDFAERFIFDRWRLHRVGLIEQNLYALAEAEGETSFDTGDPARDTACSQAATFQVKEKTFNVLSLYQARLQRSIHKEFELLRKTQKDRKAAELADVKHAIELARLRRLAAREAAQPDPQAAPQVVEFPTPSPAIGSVCSAPPSDPAPPPATTLTTPENLAA